jgi:hypothetical protein
MVDINWLDGFFVVPRFVAHLGFHGLDFQSVRCPVQKIEEGNAIKRNAPRDSRSFSLPCHPHPLGELETDVAHERLEMRVPD